MHGISCKRTILIFGLVVLVAGLFLGCQCPTQGPIPPTPTNTPRPTFTSVPPTATKPPSTTTPVPPTPPASAPVFAAGYAILTGQPAVMDAAAAALRTTDQANIKGVWLERVDALPLSDVKTCEALPACLQFGADMRLYRVTGPDRDTPPSQAQTEGVIAWLYDTYTNQKRECLFVDPVYRTGSPPPRLAEGNPWIAGGSPWIAGGSGIVGPVGTNTGFWSQWAFSSTAPAPGLRPGIAIAGPGGVGPAAMNEGKDVRVGVFDTSPFSAPALVQWVSPPLDLQIRPVPTPQGYAPFAQPAPSGRADIRDHGLFVSGMVHAVAPSSPIHLYPVLDNQGFGDLWTLAQGLYEFTRAVASERQSISGAVINLSLGLHPEAGSVGGLPKQVTSLQTLVTAASCQGIVVVAAAGNDSAGRAVQPAQMPASFPEAIAVAASNMAGGRACYSNQGEIMAPGGEATEGCAGTFGPPSLVGLVTQSLAAQSGYAYWAGSSFSAPMVSGLAALLLEQEAQANPQRWQSQPVTLPGRVAARINGGTVPSTDPAAGMRIINVPNSLALPIQP